MKKSWQLFWIFRRVSIMKMMEYRTDFFFWSVVSIVWTIFNFLFFNIITTISSSIAGWDRAELLVVVATFTIIDAFTWSFFYRNMRFYTEAIFSGFIDHLMTKPVSLQYLLTTQESSYTNIFRLFIGIAALIVAIVQLPTTPSLLMIIIYIFLLICSLILLYSLWFFCSTWAFWIEKLNNINDVFPALREIYRMPRAVYTGMFSLMFTTIFPLLLITAIPSEFLTGKAVSTTIVSFLSITGVAFLLSRWFFCFSLRNYSGVGR